ncbi:MAG: glycosyltransferase family 4 protein [Candidatus Thermoplasmatota archaeon]
MRVLMILSNPFMVDPRVHKEAKALMDAGHEVTVVVWDRRREYPEKDTVDGIRLVRIHNKGLMRVLRSDLFRNPLWWRKAYKKGLEIFDDGFEFDVVHCHDLDTLYAGVKLKKKLGVKLVYDAHELWRYLIEDSVPNFVSKLSFYMEKKLVKKVDHLITVSRPFFEYFSSIADCQVTLVMNCKDLKYERYNPPENQVFRLIYIGGMKKRRFFPEIIDVCTKLDDVKLVLAGKTEDMFYEIKEYSKKFDNVDFLGTVPTEDILPLTRKSDATFIIVDPKSRHYQKTLFNKQFEAMVTGRPIIVTKGTFAGEMTEELNCGITVEYNEESVRKAIIKLRDNPDLCEKLGKNALNAAKNKYNWKSEKQKLLEVYEEKI